MTTYASVKPEHGHNYGTGNPLAERNTARAVALTAAMMVVEIAGGWYYNSMALLADGWHMSSHALALGLSMAAYVAARKLAADRRFTFGTWKIEVLGGYTSAILLVLVAALMLYQSVERLFVPAAIHYDEAISIAVVGLAVNLACAWLLKGSHHDHGGGGHHHHGHGHGHGHAHHDHHDHSHQHGHGHGHGADGHEDLNLRSAYVHVMADAATSVLAIAALFGGRLLNAVWLDPVMGIVGAALVAVWAYGLLRDTGRVLLDAEMDAPVVAEVVEVIEASPIKAAIRDLHVWRVGLGAYACIISLETTEPCTPDYFKQLLSVHEELAHVTVELHGAQRA